jgi:F420-non-reducing hydrogenase large subunit
LDKVHFHVVEVRGFEKFLEGRYIEDAPIYTPRICGICQVAHHLASAKAVDNVFGVKIPETAELLRNLMHQGATIHSHALHFYFLAAPDLMFPTTDDVLRRNILGIAKEHPEIVKEAIELRKIGQAIVKVVGGRAIHPVTAVVGGQSKPLKEEEREELLKLSERAIELSEKSIEIGKKLLENLKDNDFLNFTSETPAGWGYTVFGNVIKGMDVADLIANSKTKATGMFRDLPEKTIIINSITLKTANIKSEDKKL